MWSTAFLLLLLLLCDPRPNIAQTEALTTVAAAYTAGRFDEARSALSQDVRSSLHVATLGRDLRRDAAKWPDQILAGLALEAASVAAPLVAADLRLFGEPTRIIEIGCARLRGSRQTPFEHTWHLAVLAFLTGPASDRLGGRAEAFTRDDPVLDEHLRHVRQRFPDSPDVAYGLGVVYEARFHTWRRTWGPGQLGPGDRNPAPAYALGWLRAAGELFEQARSFHALRGEATLRLGAVKFQQHRVDEAIVLWQEVPDLTEDPSVQYLAHVFTARALVDLNQASAGEAAYRRALSVRSAAQSALVPLAALLFAAGDHHQAALLAETVLRGTSEADPLSWYLEPGHRDWPARLHALREATRQ